MSLQPTSEQAALTEELNAMMRDPRYLTDPAFRQQVVEKLAASFNSPEGPLGSVFKLSRPAPQY